MHLLYRWRHSRDTCTAGSTFVARRAWTGRRAINFVWPNDPRRIVNSVRETLRYKSQYCIVVRYANTVDERNSELFSGHLKGSCDAVHIHLFVNGLQYNDAGSPPEPPLLTPSLDQDDVITDRSLTLRFGTVTPRHRVWTDVASTVCRILASVAAEVTSSTTRCGQGEVNRQSDIAPLLLAMLIGYAAHF